MTRPPRFARPTLLSLDDRALPSGLTLLDVTTSDFTAFDVRYEVTGAGAPPTAVRAYLSADATLDVADVLLSETRVLSDPAELAVGTHQTVLPLDARAPVREGRRFVLVAADPGQSAMVAVPLLGAAETIDKNGVVTPIGQVTDEAGPFTGAILPGTADHARLVDLSPVWPASERFIFGYHDGETAAWQRAEDRRAQATVVPPLAALVGLVRADLARVPAFWGRAAFSINEAYDSLHHHAIAYSRHYEARAVDLGIFDGPAGHLDTARLAGLAWLAGFDFVYNEDTHVHVSERAAFPTGLTQQALQQSLVSGLQLGRIDSPVVAYVLGQTLTGLDTALRQGNYVRALAQLVLFRTIVQAQAGKHIPDVGFAELVVLNVDKLIERTLGELLAGLSTP